MKYLKKVGIITLIYLTAAMQTISVYAQGYNDLSVEELNALESTFNCEEAFKSYKSFDNIYHTGYYFVENFEANNNKAFFSSTTP